MTPLALSLSFAVLGLLGVLALLWSRWPGWLKGLLVLGIAGFYFVVDGAVHDLTGWPSADPLPRRFVLLASVIEEPSAKSPGHLDLWVNALEDDGKATAAPRAHRLPYSKSLHGVLDEASKKQRQGVSQIGSADPLKGRGGVSWLRPGSNEQQVKIRDLPAPQLPEK